MEVEKWANFSPDNSDNLKELDASLEANQYLGGDFPNAIDRDVYTKFNN
jgi:hypothetical protein